MEEGQEAPCTLSDSTEVRRKQFAHPIFTLIYLRICPPMQWENFSTVNFLPLWKVLVDKYGVWFFVLTSNILLPRPALAMGSPSPPVEHGAPAVHRGGGDDQGEGEHEMPHPHVSKLQPALSGKGARAPWGSGSWPPMVVELPSLGSIACHPRQA